MMVPRLQLVGKRNHFQLSDSDWTVCLCTLQLIGKRDYSQLRDWDQ